MRLLYLWMFLRFKSFNPRICKRCDFHNLRCCLGRGSFNPRICKRCDIFSVISLSLIISFNPRICKRCDSYFQTKPATHTVSIHASVKDATSFASSFPFSLSSFNPRICKRCDRLIICVSSFLNAFQSTHL